MAELEKGKRRFFIATAGIFTLSAAVKAISATQSVPLMALADPIFTFLSNRHMALLLAAVEITLAVLVIQPRRSSLSKSTIIAWISAVFVLYHIALAAIGYVGPCPCFGNVYSWLQLSPVLEQRIAAGMAATLLTFSLCIIIDELPSKSPQQDV